MTQRIFISYRRQDSRGDAGRIYDRLRPEFGEAGLFMDVAHIPLGVNFVRVLREEVAKCQVLLAVIGPGWLEARDDDGSRRLDNPNDFVRVEIAAALARDIPVIPILLEGTKMPKASALPADLHELAQRNALDVRHSSFHADMDRLVMGLKSAKLVAKPPQSLPRQPTAINATAFVATQAPVPNKHQVPQNNTVLRVQPPWGNRAPGTDLIPAARGNWLDDFNVGTAATLEPQEFTHYYIVSCYISGFTSFSPGTIVSGHVWNTKGSSNISIWSVRHGHGDSMGRAAIPSDYLTYLGTTWRPEYAQLSDEVFKKLGGKPLKRFVTHP